MWPLVQFSLVVALESLLLLPASAEARVWRIRADGSGEAPTIPAAMDSAAAGDEVVLEPGTYSWTTQATHPYSMVALKPGVSLRGLAGSASTILDAEGVGRVLLCEDVGAVSITGLTILRGASKDPTHFLGGGGVYVLGTSTLSFTDCVFRNNLGWHGGGLLTESNVTVRSCEFLDNVSVQEGGGGALHGRDNAEVLVYECRFVRNSVGGHGSSQGGAIHTLGECRVSNSWFEGNYANGVFGASGGAIWSYGSLEVTGSMFVRNSSRAVDGNAGGGGVSIYGPVTMRNCIFVGNLAQAGIPSSGLGGALFADPRALLDITACTVVSNRATGAYPIGGLRGGSIASGAVSECIFAWNDGVPMDAASVSVACSDFYGNTGGDSYIAIDGGGNFFADPQFCAVDPLVSLNLQLQQDSPCALDQHPGGSPCQLVGAAPVGCKSVSVKPMTWGGVKQEYRR